MVVVGWGGGDHREGQHVPEAPATSPLTCASILILELRAAALRNTVGSAPLNFIVFIKLIYVNQCDHLIKTFPRALCWLLNDVRAAGLMLRVLGQGLTRRRWGSRSAMVQGWAGPGWPPLLAGLRGFSGRGCAVFGCT